jgi:hypothetical protein
LKYRFLSKDNQRKHMELDKDKREFDKDIQEAQRIAEEAEGGTRHVSGWSAWIVPVLALSWSIFQLSVAS